MPDQVPVVSEALPATISNNSTASEVSLASESTSVEVVGNNEGSKDTVKVDFKPIDYSMFENLKAGIKPEVKPEVEKEVIEESPTLEQPVEKVEENQVINFPGKTNSRDYSGLDQEEIKLFKRMDNASFNKLMPIYKEHKTIKETLANKEKELETLKNSSTTLPSNYLVHPQAYTLSPEFQKMSKTYNDVSYEAQHWEQQLINIRNGRGWQDLVINKKTGDYEVSEPIAVEEGEKAQYEVQVQRWLAQAQHHMNENYTKLKGFTDQYRERNQRLLADLSKKEEEFFPAYKDKSFKGWQHANAFINDLPPEIKERGLPTSVTAKLYATVVLLSEENQALKKAQSVKIAVRQDQRQAGPTNSSFTAAGTSLKKGESIDDWNALKQI